MNPQPRLVVAICTHNPRPEYLEQTLTALRIQSLAIECWDLLIIDNNSEVPLAECCDISWHPRGRIVREDELGIAHARRRAVREADCAEILLFVDDDNVLAPDYLESGLRFGDSDSKLGCWGGQLLPAYESAPPPWFGPFAKYLAIFPLTTDLVATDFSGNYDYLPPTAGMFLRSELAGEYQAMSLNDPLRLALGRQGKDGIRGGEDTDLALFVLKRGYRTGRFKALVLTHLMPPERLTLGYLERLIEEIYAGTGVIRFLHEKHPPLKVGVLESLRRRWQIFRLPEVPGRIYAAQLRGEEKASRLIVKLNPSDRTGS